MTAPQIYVLDAWPIVVEWLLGKQPAAHKFTVFLNKCEQLGTRLLITLINRGEVLYTLAKRATLLEQQIALELLERLCLEVISTDDNLVDAAIEIKKTYPCSYADCFAAALGMRERACVVTGGSEFLGLSDAGLITLVWLGA